MRRSLDVALAGLILLAALAACGRDEAPSPPPTTEAAAEAAAEKILVRKPDGEHVATFRLTEEHAAIRFGPENAERVFHRRLDGDAKRLRRYHERGGGPVAQVRANPELPVITVRAPNGELRWRVRLGQRRILVSDHPDLPPFELMRPKPGVLRVRYVDGDDLGRVVFQKGSPVVQVHDAAGEYRYRVRSDRRSAFYGVLLVPDLDPVERYVLMTELLVRDR